MTNDNSFITVVFELKRLKAGLRNAGSMLRKQWPGGTTNNRWQPHLPLLDALVGKKYQSLYYNLIRIRNLELRREKSFN